MLKYNLCTSNIHELQQSLKSKACIKIRVHVQYKGTELGDFMTRHMHATTKVAYKKIKMFPY